jgi:glycosyltransferase involved in cell wall biosynthesis
VSVGILPPVQIITKEVDMPEAISVITATISGRENLLQRAIASVQAQHYAPIEHLIMLDQNRIGGAKIKNILAARAIGDWLVFLDDDDELFPEHLQKLIFHAADYDVIYSYSSGNTRYNLPFTENGLLVDSIVSHTAIVRKSLFLNVGGFPEENGYDWEFWKRALRLGARFKCIPEATWHYDMDETRPHESLGGLPWQNTTD